MAITLEVQHYAKQASNKHIILLFAFVILFSFSVSSLAKQDKSLGENSNRVNALLEAVKSRKIQYKLTKIDEIKALLGEPQKEEEKDLGERIALCMSYPDIEVWFRRHKEDRDGSILAP